LQHGATNVILSSRRGRAFFNTHTYIPTKQKLAYLESRENFNLRLVACDATCLEATSALIKSIEQPIGGCFLMTLALADALFMHQTEKSFSDVCNAKLKALKTFTTVLPIDQLDFFVSFSSIIALLGNAGQANYAV
jgi:KR domain